MMADTVARIQADLPGWSLDHPGRVFAVVAVVWLVASLIYYFGD